MLPPSKKLFVFSEEFIERLVKNWKKNNWEQYLQKTSLSEAWEILTEKLIQSVEENVPVSKVSSGADRKTLYVIHQ